MKGIFVAVLLAVAVVGCGKVPQVGPTRGDLRLYEAASTPSSSFVAIIDPTSHSTLGQLPLGTPSPDWRHLYSVSSGILTDIDPQTGQTLNTLNLVLPYQLPQATMTGVPGGLSQNGAWLVLETPTSASNPPAESYLIVVDTTFSSKPITVDLPGYFQFDAISNDGRRLYLTQYLSGSDYQVRFYDVSARHLDGMVVIDKFDPTEPMTGMRVTSVASADGQWLFTVYARARKGAFIHALNLGAPYSLCIELPGSGWLTDGSVFRWSLALSPGGSHLYASNGALGVISDIPTTGQSSMAIGRTVAVGAPPAPDTGPSQTFDATTMGSGGAVVSLDGRTLAIAGRTGIEWMDTATLKVTGLALTSSRIWSLALSPDGTKLYALNDSGAITELSMAGGAVQATFDPAVGQPMALLRVEATR